MRSSRTFGRATRRAVIGSIIASLAAAASGQAFRPWQPSVGRAGFQFLAGGKVLAALPQQANIIARWSADDIPVQADGTTISSWTSGIGGFAAVQKSGISLPTYKNNALGGKPAVVFNGSQGLFYARASNAFYTAIDTSEFSLIAVYRNKASTTYGGICGANNSGTPGVMLCDTTTRAGAFIANDDLFHMPSVGLNKFTTLGYHRSATNNKFGYAGGIARTSIRGSCFAAQSNTSGASQAYPFGLGDFGATGGGSNIELYEVILWNGALNAADTLQVEKWACDKYGQAYPWAGNSYFDVYHGDSNAIGTGATTGANTYAYLLENGKGRSNGPLGHYTVLGVDAHGFNVMKNSAPLDGIDTMSSITGIPTQLIVMSYDNPGGTTWAGYAQTYLQARRTADPTTRVVFGTSQDWGGTAEDAARTAYDNYWATAANRVGLMDAYVPVHETDANGGSTKIGPVGAVPGGDSPSYPTTYHSDIYHFTNAGQAEFARVMGTGVV